MGRGYNPDLWLAKKSIRDIKEFPKSPRELGNIVRRSILNSQGYISPWKAAAIAASIIVAVTAGAFLLSKGDGDEPIDDTHLMKMWDGLNSTALNSADVNKTVAELNSDIANCNALFKQTQINIDTLDKIADTPVQNNKHIDENISVAQAILSKSMEDITKKDISILDGIKANLSELEGGAVALKTDLVANYETALSNLEQNIRGLKEQCETVKAYRKSFEKYVGNFKNKTEERDKYIAAIKSLGKLRIIEATIKSLKEKEIQYLKNLTQFNETSSAFKGEPVDYKEADISTLETRLGENITAAQRTTLEIEQRVGDWYNTGITKVIDRSAFSQRYNSLTPEQQELFLNKTQSKDFTDGNFSNGEIKEISLYIPNDPTEKYTAIFNFFDEIKITANYNPSKAPEIDHIFHYLAYGK